MDGRTELQVRTANRIGQSLQEREAPTEKFETLTFDDGYEGVYQNAFPILQKYHSPATIFVIGERLTNRGKITSFSFLSVSQLREMMQFGIEVGSHSLSHRDLVLLDDRNLEIEIRDSKKMIEDTLGQSIQHFCYPLGNFNHHVAETVKTIGYASACSTIMGQWNTKDELFQLKRIATGYQQTVMQFIYRLEILSWVNR